MREVDRPLPVEIGQQVDQHQLVPRQIVLVRVDVQINRVDHQVSVLGLDDTAFDRVLLIDRDRDLARG